MLHPFLLFASATSGMGEKASLTPKEFQERVQERVQERTEQEQKTLDTSISVQSYTPHDMQFYRWEAGPGAIDQYVRLPERMAPENHYDLNHAVATRSEVPRRHTVSMDPYDVYEDQVSGFLDFASEHISTAREGKLEFVEMVLEEPADVDPDRARDWFEERDTVDFDTFNTDVTYSDRDLGLGKQEKVLEQTVDAYWDDITANTEIDELERIERGLLLDLVKTLQGLAFQKDDGFKETVDAYERFFRKFKPEQYRELTGYGPDYEALPIFDGRNYTLITSIVGSCLGNEDYSTERRQHMDDPYTVVHAIGKNGSLEGYMRSFLMEDADGNDFLGIDTLEVPKTGGIDMDNVVNDFTERTDILKAGAMAAVQLGDMLDVDYVAGRDARVRFGVRQGYSDTRRTITYRKHGDPVPYNAVALNEERDVLGRYVFTDEIEDWTGKHGSKITADLPDAAKVTYVEPSHEDASPQLVAYRTDTHKVPAFATFPDTSVYDLRGFRTEDEWHTNSAYILMEYPDSEN